MGCQLLYLVTNFRGIGWMTGTDLGEIVMGADGRCDWYQVNSI